jgi:two-component sensor histidine kinase
MSKGHDSDPKIAFAPGQAGGRLECSAQRSNEAEYLRILQEVAGLGVYFRNFKTGESFWSEKMFEIRGFDPRDGVPSLEQSRSTILDSDHVLPIPNRPAVEPGTKEKSFFIVMRARHAQTNREIWLKSKGLIIFDADGSPETVIGVQMDVNVELNNAEKIRKIKKRQIMLAREVDHRAKNILATALSVVRLTQAENIDDFRSAVEHRISALARAHSILADQSWSGASLRELIQGEISAFDGASRCSLHGPDLVIASTQAQAVSLILHELTTNAAKYGALSQPAGAIRISWSEMKMGGVLIEWSENGCQNIVAPSRLGFGSRLIAATLGHQIGGEIKTLWRPGGVLHELVLGPAALMATPPQQRQAKASAVVNSGSIRGSRVLIVEDEALIALSLNEMLRDAGCVSVGPASNVDEALSIIENNIIDMALIDLNLNGESSLPVAHALRSRRIPFTFVTGYNCITEEFNSICPSKFLKKPIIQSELNEILRIMTNIKNSS